jgi:hypothetical protein
VETHTYHTEELKQNSSEGIALEKRNALYDTDLVEVKRAKGVTLPRSQLALCYFRYQVEQEKANSPAFTPVNRSVI